MAARQAQEAEGPKTSYHRRLSLGVRRSFPQVDEDEARAFVQGGSTLKDCSQRSFLSRLLPCKKAKFHYTVDESWRFLEWSATPSAPSKRRWHLADISDVYPVVLDEGHVATSAPGRSRKMHLEFEAVHGRRRIKFRAASRQDVKMWVTAIEGYLVSRQRRSVGMDLAEMAVDHFARADTNDDGDLEFREVKALLRSMNFNPSPEYLSELFSQFDFDHDLHINQGEFRHMFQKMLEKVPLRVFISQYSVPGGNGDSVLPHRELLRFFREVQKDTACTADSVRALLSGLSEPLVVPATGALTEAGFSAIMCSGKNSILDPRHARLYQDMTKPLSHYWINCSHNTYLEGAQIAGTSSVEQYIEVLSYGCRCVEIDLWDGPNGDPIVTHGYTLSSKLSFLSVAQALQDHAFDHSEFPLILSLENHCSTEQVVSVGRILEEVFGDRLLKHAKGTHEGEPLVSPQEARRRVLVKGSLVKIPEDVEVDRHATARVTARGSDKGSWAVFPMRPRASGSEQLALGVRRFNSLIYLVAKKCHSISEAREPCNISSFKESRAIKQCNNNGPELKAYHSKYLSRIYPPGHNIDSRNLAPLLHWGHGAQLVALNFQTMDTSVLLNEGLFREENGGFGYVLKPPLVMDANADVVLKDYVINLTVISAHFLPRPEGMDDKGSVTKPLVAVTLHTPEFEPWQHETTVREGGFTPEWNESFEIEVIREDFSILTFEVFHQESVKSRYFMAAAAFPVSGLREGVRWVPLWDRTRREVPNCGILVRVEFKRKGGDVTPRSRIGSAPTSRSSQVTDCSGATAGAAALEVSVTSSTSTSSWFRPDGVMSI